MDTGKIERRTSPWGSSRSPSRLLRPGSAGVTADFDRLPEAVKWCSPVSSADRSGGTSGDREKGKQTHVTIGGRHDFATNRKNRGRGFEQRTRRTQSKSLEGIRRWLRLSQIRKSPDEGNRPPILGDRHRGESKTEKLTSWRVEMSKCRKKRPRRVLLSLVPSNQKSLRPLREKQLPKATAPREPLPPLSSVSPFRKFFPAFALVAPDWVSRRCRGLLGHYPIRVEKVD